MALLTEHSKGIPRDIWTDYWKVQEKVGGRVAPKGNKKVGYLGFSTVVPVVVNLVAKLVAMSVAMKGLSQAAS